MRINVLLVGAAAIALTAGAASAATHKAAGGSYAPPSQPIPYSQLDAYLKAAPAKRAAIIASAPAASDVAANVSATAPAATPALPADTAPAMAPPPVNPAAVPDQPDNGPGTTGASPPPVPIAGGTMNAPAGSPSGPLTNQPPPQ